MLLPAKAVRIGTGTVAVVVAEVLVETSKTLAFTHCSILDLVACSAETLAESFPGNPEC